MADLYLARLARIVPPRDTGIYGPTSLIGPSAPGVRAIAISNVAVVKEIDTDLFQLTPPANAPTSPGSVGRALLECAFWCTSQVTGPCFILFSNVNSVVANGLALSGNTMAWPIFPSWCTGTNTALGTGGIAGLTDPSSFWEVDPIVDKYFSAGSAPNASNVSGILYYRIRSFPTQQTPGSG